MAEEDANVINELRSLTECCICKNMIADPRGLPCIHTFCLQCMKNYAASMNRISGDLIPCPVCRKDFNIPVVGMEGLQKNFFFDRLVEILKISKSEGKDNDHCCDACTANRWTDESEIAMPTATMYCIQCREKLCCDCSAEHSRNKLSRKHQVIELGCAITEMLENKRESDACNLHLDEKIKMYCFDCKCVICMMCFAEGHASHKCTDVRKAAEEFQSEIGSDFQRIMYFPEEIAARKEFLEEEKKLFMKELQEAERQIKLKCKTLKELADEQTRLLIDTVSAVEQKEFKRLDGKRDEVERHFDVVQRYMTYCREITSRGSHSDICRAVTDLHATADELVKQHETHVREKFRLATVSFAATDTERFIKTDDLIGKVKERAKEDTIAKKRRRGHTFFWCSALVLMTAAVVSYFTSEREVLQLSGSLDVPCMLVVGVTSMENKIYVLCEEDLDSILLVYQDSYPYKLIYNLHLDIRIPVDIVDNPYAQSLYVTDPDTRCVWKVSETEGRIQKDRYCLVYDFSSKVLSISKDEEFILVQNRELVLRDMGGSYVRGFDLPDQMKEIEHAIEMPNGNFMVAYIDRESKGGLCELSGNGYIVQCYNALEEKHNLIHPFHLSLFSDSRFLLVDKQTIILLDFNLKWKGICLEGKEKASPGKLHYDQEKKRLITVHDGKYVDLYLIQ